MACETKTVSAMRAPHTLYRTGRGILVCSLCLPQGVRGQCSGLRSVVDSPNLMAAEYTEKVPLRVAVLDL